MDWPVVSGPEHHSIAELFFRTLGIDSSGRGAARGYNRYFLPLSAFALHVQIAALQPNPSPKW